MDRNGWCSALWVSCVAPTHNLVLYLAHETHAGWKVSSAYALLTALAAAVQTCKDPELTERVLSRGEIEASASNGGEDPQVDWGGPGNGAGGSRS